MHNTVVTSVVLTDEDLVFFSRPVNGKGGMQSLLRALQKHRSGRVQYLTQLLAERVKRYAMKYGDGGWQRRLLRLVVYLAPVIPAPPCCQEGADVASKRDVG